MKFSSSPKRPQSWTEMKLVDVCSTFTSGGTPSRKRPEFFVDGSIPWVKTKELNDGVVTDVEEFITPDAVKNSSAKILPENTVLLAMYGATVGKLGVLGIEAACNQACAAMVPKGGVVDFRFLYYLLMRHREEIIGQATGGAQQNLSGELIKNFVFDFPTFQEQQAIAKSLWLLDEKIAMNRAMSKTLENIAQTIFKSWFIDFDPVKAKSAGEKPLGIDDATSALFPDSLEDSESGPIPMGWKLSQIGDEVECVGGSTPSTSNSEFWDGDIFWTTPKDLSRQIGLVTTSSERRITGKGLQRISSGVLPVNSVLMSSRAPIGYLSINAVPTAINQGFIALRKNSRFTPLFLLFWLKTNMAEIKNRAGGGTFAEISKNAFKSIPFVVPDEETMQKFDELAEPILRQLTALTLQNQELIEMRESLLPRLISGELQIPEDLLVS